MFAFSSEGGSGSRSHRVKRGGRDGDLRRRGRREAWGPGLLAGLMGGDNARGQVTRGSIKMDGSCHWYCFVRAISLG